MFFHIFNKEKSNYQRPVWRSLLLVLVICGVVLAFWQNSQKQLDVLNSRLNVWDDSKVLSNHEKTALQDMIGQFKARYGIDVRMEILETPLRAPESATPLIYIGINSATSETLISIPAWIKLNPGFPARIQNDLMLPRIKNKEYAYALADALRAVWEEMGTAE